jgi:hypothetical protein
MRRCLANGGNSDAEGITGASHESEPGSCSGSNSTVGLCQQTPAPVGPYRGGSSGRVSRISAGGKVTTVASGFPSAQDAMGDLLGVADVAFLEGQPVCTSGRRWLLARQP